MMNSLALSLGAREISIHCCWALPYLEDFYKIVNDDWHLYVIVLVD
jgi:hypothetical protein